MAEKILKSISELHFDPANARKHGEKNIKAIESSLARFGQQIPIVIDKKNVVRKGNGTLKAATNLGWQEIWITESELEASELTAFAIADNRTAELAEWDVEGLTEQLAGLDEELANIAYSDFDINVDDFEFKDPGEPKESKLEDNKITVTCDSLEQKDELYSELNDRGYKVK